MKNGFTSWILNGEPLKNMNFIFCLALVLFAVQQFLEFFLVVLSYVMVHVCSYKSMSIYFMRLGIRWIHFLG